VFERFTDRARQSVVFAQEEARQLGHNYMGTEHLLLGLLREQDSIASRALERLGTGLDTVRAEVESIIGRGGGSPAGHIEFTPRAKKVLELSLREALQLGHNYIGTEHILLGLVREGEGVAAQVLVARGAGLGKVRQTVLAELGSVGGPRPPAPSARSRTPAADEVIAAAEQLAGGAPVGSQHLLEALAQSEESLAAKALAALGVDADALAAKLGELGVEGTTDTTPEETAARGMEVRVEDDAVHVVLRDPAAIELGRAVTAQTGGPARGADPILTGPFIGLWQSTLSGLRELRRALTPPEPEDPGTARMTLVQRAIQGRWRRRRPT
jgi:ATP-dependent Clp protease ATP-binding subunit ClpC